MIFPSIPPASFQGSSLISILTRLALTDNLAVCLDAGDSDSYGPDLTAWDDVSGNSNNFYRGTDGTAQASDPTFNGSSGGLSSAEFFSFDGGDRFRLAIPVPASLNTFHKNNALVGSAAWIYFPASIPAAAPIFGDGASDVDEIGFQIYVTTGAVMRATVVNGSGGAFLQDASDTVSLSKWNFLGFGYDESTGNGRFNVNNAVTTISIPYGAPSASDATLPFEIGAMGGSNLLPNGSRVAMVALWTSALTAENLSAIFAATRQRFGV